MLHDDVLLGVFVFYVDKSGYRDFERSDKQMIEGWMTLAHVCRRWRSVVFQSPRCLNLRLFCAPNRRPARDTLDIWPPLPLVVHDAYRLRNGLDNILGALEHNDRVCEIKLDSLTSPRFECVTNSAAMQKPFPGLTYLLLYNPQPYGQQQELILPDSFLGGTAPRLRNLSLSGVPFPGLPNLLLSATHLVHLHLSLVPPSGYISPEAMATSISALTSLESFGLQYRDPFPGGQRPPPSLLTRSILPSLTMIIFKGASEYLEEILARIDAPRLDYLHIIFFDQIAFDLPQLFQFISRIPALRAPEMGRITFSSQAVLRFPSQTSDYGVLRVEIPYTTLGWQFSSLEQVCTSSLPPVSTLKDLYILDNPCWRPCWQDGVENTRWLDLLRSFVAVKDLYLFEEFATRIAPVLQELVGVRTMEVLPTLENIFLEGFQLSNPVHEGIEKFAAARRLTNRPVTVSRWNKE